MGLNIRTLEDYKDYLLDLDCSPEHIESAEYHFSDFKGEQIYYRLATNGVWRWKEMCDTGGYWEPIEDLPRHVDWYFGKPPFKCVCWDAQFLTIHTTKEGTNPTTGEDSFKHESGDCVVCWYKANCIPEEEIVLSEFEEDLHDEILADINGDD